MILSFHPQEEKRRSGTTVGIPKRRQIRLVQVGVIDDKESPRNVKR